MGKVQIIPSGKRSVVHVTTTSFTISVDLPFDRAKEVIKYSTLSAARARSELTLIHLIHDQMEGIRVEEADKEIREANRYALVGIRYMTALFSLSLLMLRDNICDKIDDAIIAGAATIRIKIEHNHVELSISQGGAMFETSYVVSDGLKDNRYLLN